MLIEFQTTATNFVYPLREQLKAAPMPVTEELTDSDGRIQIVNRVLIGNQTHVRTDALANFEIRVAPPGVIQLISAKQMQIVQPVTVELVYLDDLVKWGDVPSPITPVSLWIIFDVSLKVVGGVAVFSFSYDSVFPPDPALDAQLKKLIGVRTSPVDLGVQDIVEGLEVFNAGIVCQPGAFAGSGSVALRIELGSPDSGVAEWQRFLNGTYDDLLSTPGMRPGLVPPPAAERWAVFVEGGILEAYARKLIGDSFGPGKSVQLRSDIDVHWSSPGGQARLDAAFKAIAIDACDLGILGKYDIRLDVQIPILLSVPQDNVLRKNLKINFWENDIDAGACVIAAGVFWPIIGWGKDMKPGEMVLYEALILLIPLRFVAATILANETKPNPPDTTWARISDDEFQSDTDFSKKSGTAQSLVLLDYRGLHRGLVLTGRQLQFPDTCPPLIESDHCGFEFKPPQIPCSSVAGATQDQLQRDFTRHVYAAASAIVDNVGEKSCPGMPQMVQLQKWDERFLDDALVKQLNMQTVEDDFIDRIAIKLRCPQPPADYYLDPKPVQLLLKTNGGARVFTYAPLPKPSQEELDKLALVGAIRAVNDCTQLIDPWWEHFHRYNPRWSIDPPAFRSPGDRQLWVMAFAGLVDGDRITAIFGGRRLQSGLANAQGRAVVTVLHPAQSVESLTLEYRPHARERLPAGGRMFMSQVALTELSQCDLSAPVLRLEMKRMRGRRTLYAIHADGFTAVDLTVPAAPRVLLERRGQHLRGAAFDGDALLVFASDKPVIAETLPSRPAPRACGQEKPPVICALAAADAFYVVRERVVDVFDRARCHLRALPLDHPATAATMAGGYVVLGGPEGLQILAVSQDSPTSQFFEIGAVESLQTPELPGLPNSVLVATRERTSLVELPLSYARSHQLVVLAEYDELPWFAGALQFDSFVATTSILQVTILSIVGRVEPCHPPA
jgi:hypothetical protein